MENSAEAIKMAGAMMIFCMALALVMTMFSQARAAADGVMNRRDNFSTYYDADDTAKLNRGDQFNKFDLASQKVVGAEEVISSMSTYYKDGSTILFYKAQGDIDNTNGTVYYNTDEITPVVLYYSEALPTALNKSSLLLVNPPVVEETGKVKENEMTKSNRAIFGLSAADEIARNEPWIGGNEKYVMFLKDLLAGKNSSNSNKWERAAVGTRTATISVYIPDYNRTSVVSGKRTLQYGFLQDTSNGFGGSINSFYDFNKKARFVERVGEYDYTSKKVDATGELVDGSIVELENGEKAEADHASNKKKVIQFIYLY